MTILVTGGTGLVGSHLVESLIAEGHHPSTIRALVRSHSDPAFLKEKGVQLCYGDLLDGESLREATRDVKSVFHCAAALTEKKKEVYWKINCQGTEHLLEAARSARVETFIYVSTIGIYGPLKTAPAAEDHPQSPLRAYAVTKLEAEKKVWEYSRTCGMKSVVLRPTLIVGERDRGITPRIIGLVRKKIVPLIKGGEALFSFVHAGDVANALILASESERAVGNAYNVQGFVAPLKAVLEFFMHALGSNARIVHTPYPLAYVGALLIDGIYATTRASQTPICARKGLQQLTRDLVFDTTKIRRDLAFEPRYGMEESFQRAIRWQLEQGY